jgi:hypothetical protein
MVYIQSQLVFVHFILQGKWCQSAKIGTCVVKKQCSICSCVMWSWVFKNCEKLLPRARKEK